MNQEAQRRIDAAHTATRTSEKESMLRGMELEEILKITTKCKDVMNPVVFKSISSILAGYSDRCTNISPSRKNRKGK